MSESQLPLGSNPLMAIARCKEAFGRLAATTSELTDATARAASRLPEWTVGHVLTHIARNAEGHARRLEAALEGVDVPRYPGGADQRNGEIAAGAGRPAVAIVTDVLATQARLEAVWSEHAKAGWPYGHLLGVTGYTWPLIESPARRLSEIEMHHVDLGLGYTPAEWSDEYVDWDLPILLDSVPRRLAPADRRVVLAWVAGRGPEPAALHLAPYA